MKRNWTLLLIATGFGLFIAGSVYRMIFIPSSVVDETPEAIAYHVHHSRVAFSISWIGIGTFLFGCIAHGATAGELGASGSIERFVANAMKAWPVGVGLFIAGFFCTLMGLGPHGHGGRGDNPFALAIATALLWPDTLFPGPNGSMGSILILLLETSLTWALAISAVVTAFRTKPQE